LTARLTEEERWERGRFIEFVLPSRGLRIGRVLKTFSRGESKKRVRVGLYNPNTKMYGNRGGYRGFVVTVDKDQVCRFYSKNRSRKNGETEKSKGPEVDNPPT
jgi:hypothetical protein